MVVGAGIGGLTLAQGLARRGVDVVVLERDIDLALTGGYRLHLGPGAVDVLACELPPGLWDAVQASGAGGDAFRAMHVTDRRLRLLLRVPPGEGRHLLVGRRPLRRVLASGLGSRLVLAEQATGYDLGRSSVTVRTTTGRTVRGDLLVAADGVGSVVAAQAAGRATSAPIGLVGLAGRHPDLAGLGRGAPSYLADGPALAFGTRGVGLFLTRHDPGSTGAAAALDGPSWTWGLILTRPAADHRLPDMSEAELRTRGWAPWARRLLSSTPREELGTYRFHAADPARPTIGWSASRVTALGDAVHAMPPTGGQSAATAIEDAGDLLAAVDRVTSGEAPLAVALADYHALVDARARPRVRESLAPARWITRTSGPLGGAALVAAAGAVHAGQSLVRVAIRRQDAS